MKTQALDFRDALKFCADLAGVVLSNTFDGPRVDKSERENQLSIMQSAQIFFRNELKKNSNSLDYLDRRGLTAEVQEEWEIGYAPSLGEALAVHLKRENKHLGTAEQLFLTQQDSSGGFHDKFRGRVMFPIRDERGDLVGFGGRIIGDGNPKYINSGETPLYHKSRVLYGINRAKDRMMKSRHAVLVEGYLDVIACHRAGVTEAVASCGTALAEGQIKLMKRFADKVTILYDGDSAGIKAASRAIELFHEADFPCRIAILPKGDDPDTLLKTKGPEAIREVIAKAETPFDFEIHKLENDLGIESNEFWEQISTLLAKATSELELEKHLLRLAGRHPTINNPTRAVNALRREVKALKPGKTQQKKKQELGAQAATRSTTVLPAEAVVFKAYFDERLRDKVWAALSTQGLCITPAAIDLWKSLCLTFNNEAPKGPAIGWIGRLPEADQQFFADLDFDSGVQELNDQYVDESITNLRDHSKSRELDKDKSNIPPGDDDALRDYFNKLRKHKGVNESQDQT
jgi:DNA primase